MKRLIFFTGFVLILFAAACANKIAGPGGTAVKPDVARISVANADASEPAMAVDGANVYVTYVEHSGKDSADVYVQKVAYEGKELEARVRLNEKPGEVKAWYGDPPTIAAAGGNVYVGWTAQDGEKGTTLYLSVSRNGGGSFEPPVKVNDDKMPASHGMHSLSAGADGKVYMAWLDERYLHNKHHAWDTERQLQPTNGYRFERAFHQDHPTPKIEEPKKMSHAEPNAELYFAASTDGGRTFSANRKVTAEVCPCCKSAITAAPDGRIYASWRQVLGNGCRHIAVSSSADGGTTFSEPRIVSDDDWQIDACPVSGPALRAESNGVLSAAWYTAGDAGQAGLYSAVSNDSGLTFAPRTLISNETTGGTAAMVYANGKEYAIYKILDTLAVRSPNGEAKIIENASNPSAAIVNGQLLIAFVRTDGDKKSVHVAKLAIN